MRLHLKILITAAVLVAGFLLPACSSSQDASSQFVKWQPYKQGLQAAATQDKNVFLYFRANW